MYLGQETYRLGCRVKRSKMKVAAGDDPEKPFECNIFVPRPGNILIRFLGQRSRSQQVET